MTTTSRTGTARASAAPHANERLPWPGLLALAAAGFITVLTEALPAGLLPQIGAGLGVSEALAGQLVTVYAAGSLIAAIPLATATRGWRRRPLLLLAIGGFAIANTVTALSPSYTITLVARFLAGVSAGLLWALLAGHAGRMVPDRMKGRAIAVAMAGIPLALALGVPAGTTLGAISGWRAGFGVMTGLSLILIPWVLWQVPDFPGEAPGRRLPARRIIALPGLAAVLAATLATVLAHNILYTYIAPFLTPAGLGHRVDQVLLVFGLAAVAGIWLTGLAVDRHLRRLVRLAILGFALATILLGIAGPLGQPGLIWAGVILWGLAFGGTPTLFQTASARAAGAAADIAQSMIVTAWNLAIAGGGIVGGILIGQPGPIALPWAALVLLIAAGLATTDRFGMPASQAD
ncbi:MFS transporter [Tistrella bauzanensis]|uniref:MFS transporter n=1 Tax=Tistrella arctica TaxID=3133430 RepID=A0ABU9YQI0_9PROT